MRLAWPLLVLALAATGSPAEGFDAVWGRAILWQVGDNVAVVAAAREEIIAMGEDAVPLVMARLGAASTLELRALRAVVPAIGEPFVEPLLEVVKNGEGQRLATAIELLRRLEAPAVMDVVAARWPGGLPDGAAGREAMAAAAAFGRVDMVSTIAGTAWPRPRRWGVWRMPPRVRPSRPPPRGRAPSPGTPRWRHWGGWDAWNGYPIPGGPGRAPWG